MNKLLYGESAMKSVVCVLLIFFCSLLMFICFPGITNAQDTNNQVQETELQQRVLRFAMEEYNRAVEYGRAAERIQPPSNRKTEYRQMRQSFNDALRLFETVEQRPRAYENIPSVITNFWANEHNAGVELMTNEDARQAARNPDETAKSHLENAIIIQPDSAISYAVLASLTLHMEDTLAATSLYEEAMDLRQKPAVEEFDFLIELYFVQGRIDDAVELAEEARETYPEEMVFIQYLADAYLNLGDIDDANAMIRELADMEPDNPRYPYILGTTIYQYAFSYLSEASDLYGQAWQLEEEADELEGSERSRMEQRIQNLESEAADLEREGQELADSALEELERVAELDPDNEDVFNILGMIYQNRAKLLFDKRDRSSNVMNSMEFDEEARITLYQAMENYEKAADLNPDNLFYWETLYYIYIELGMEARADDVIKQLEL